MKKVLLFNTANGSLNLGDQIINESVAKELQFVIDNSFVAEFPTHTPVSHFYQNFKKNTLINFADSCDYKFIAGTNIVAYNNFRPWPNWNVNLFNYRPYTGSVLVGSGSNPNAKKINLYTKKLYKGMLSNKHIHSVRDERTKEALEAIGLKAVNTGCATLWGLNKERCSQIPHEKSRDVIFTLTDYARDAKKDKALIDTLNKNYRNVYFWPQGSDDLDYIQQFKNDKINIIPSNLESYRKLLLAGDIDFVGTRLHAGIFAMQHKVRSIILIVDNRARDMQKTYNINAIERNDINSLEQMIQSKFATDIKIDEEKIKAWKRQFTN